MEAVAALAQIARTQRAFGVVATLMLTSYLFPQQAVVTDLEEFEFIVVGAGSAGATLATRLAEGGRPVLLVEAGGDPPLESLTPGLMGLLPHTQYDWNYTNENDNYSFQCHPGGIGNLTTGHVLGGGSSLNFMFYVRGCRGDFESWATAAKDRSWDWNGVLPYFIKSERLEDDEVLYSPQGAYHGTQGFLGVTRQVDYRVQKYLEAFTEVGNNIVLDINGDCSLGYTYPMMTIAGGVRQSTAYTLLNKHTKQRNLNVLKNTFVTKIVFDENNNAVGIKALTKDDKQIELRARREVIVSAGGLNTPRLLMLSGVGPKEHLESLNIPVRSDLPVGMNLQDHVLIASAMTAQKLNEPNPPGDPHEFPFTTFTGYVALNKSQSCPDYQSFLLMSSDPTSFLSLCVFNFGFEYEICQNLYEAGKSRELIFSVLDLLHPKSRGRVLLRSTDPKDPPLIYGGHLSDDRDVETLVDSMLDFVRVLNTTHFKSIDAELVNLKLRMCEGLQYWSREWWRCYVLCMMNTLYHYSGTCALGSVVDSRLRVLGVGRLRVVDASIMPEIVGANTNAASIMIGEKAADIIKTDHSSIFNIESVTFPFYYFYGWHPYEWF